MNRRDFLKNSGYAAAAVISAQAMMDFLAACGGGAAGTTGNVNHAALAAAKEIVDKATAHVTTWDGPTSGPKAIPGKFIVYTSQDQRNGGALGVGNGVQEACNAIGWRFRLIDGQGTTTGMTTAIDQAIALKPDAIVDGTIDSQAQKTAWQRVAAAGIKVVGWHAAGSPGPVKDPPMITNIETDPIQTGKAAGAYPLMVANGDPGLVVFTDSTYAIAIVKSNNIQSETKGVNAAGVLALEDTPLADVENRMPPLVTSLYQKYGQKLKFMAGINDLYFDTAIPTLKSLGVPASGSGTVSMVSAGDGSVSAYQRVRQGQYQVATIPEPLNLHGWQCVDELNRAFAGQSPSGYLTPVHLVTKDNIQFDGGPNNIFDPDNGYRDQYKKIWGV